MKGGENMDIVMNITPLDSKQMVATKKPTGKEATNATRAGNGFAQALNVETDKGGMDDEPKAKLDENVQLMAAMTAMVPPVIINIVPVNQAVDAVGESSSDATEESPLLLSSIMPSLVEMPILVPQEQQVADALLSTQSQLSIAAVSVLPTQTPKPVVPNNQADIVNVMPAVSPVELPNQAPNILQNELPSASLVQMPTIVAEEKQGKSATLVDTSTKQFTAAMANMTAVNPIPMVDNNKLGEFAQLTNQMQLQPQSKPITNQVDAVDNAVEEATILTQNPIVAELLPPSNPAGFNYALGKNNGKQGESKKVAMDQVDSGVVEMVKNAGIVREGEVKPILTAQVITATTEALIGGNKEMIEGVGPNLTTKTTDVFASLLSQQGVKMESQGTLEVKPVPTPVMADPYGVSSQIVEQARFVAGNKNTEMIIQLKPEHLGELTFKISVEKGIVSASFHSNNSEVRSAIESSLAQLKQEFSNQGLKVDTVGVYSGLGQFFSNGQQSNGQQQPTVKVHNKKNEEDFLEALETIDTGSQRLDGNGVDYRA